MTESPLEDPDSPRSASPLLIPGGRYDFRGTLEAVTTLSESPSEEVGGEGGRKEGLPRKPTRGGRPTD